MTAIKEHPMLFAERLVKAILDGSKTQTRRPVLSSNSTVLGYPAKEYWPHLRFDEAIVRDDNPMMQLVTGKHIPGRDVHLSVPYAHPDDSNMASNDLGWYRVRPKWEVGDRLWVRESFEVVDGSGIEKGIRYLATSTGEDDWSYVEDTRASHPTMRLGNWPSIHMPRWACRLVLEITNVRVQRAHQITDADVVAEGVERHQIEKYRKFFDKRDIHAMAFGELWNEHYGETELRWQCNPWIVAIDFRLAPTPEPH